MKLLGIVSLGLALTLGGYGVSLIVTEDVQGGRDAAGAFFLALSAIAALLGSLALWRGRRSP
jgi:hypothetical protein